MFHTSAAPVLTPRNHCVSAAGIVHLRGQEADIGNFRLCPFCGGEQGKRWAFSTDLWSALSDTAT